MVQLIVQFVLLINLLACAVMTAQVFEFRKNQVIRSFIALLGIYFFWCLCAMLMISSLDPELKIFFAKIKYLALALVAPATVSFVCGIFYSNSALFKGSTRFLIWIVPFFIFFSIVIPTLQDQFVNHFEVLTVWGARVVSWQDQRLFKIHYFHSIVLMIGGYLALTYKSLMGTELEKRQARVLMLGSVWIVVFDLYIVLSGSPMRWFVHGAIVCLPLIFSYYIVVFKLNFMKLGVIARETVFENVPTPILVLDETYKVQLQNISAKAELTRDVLNKAIFGMKDIGRNERVREFSIDGYPNWKVQARYVLGQDSQVGYILIFKNILSERLFQKELLEISEFKQRAFSVLVHDVSGQLSGVEMMLNLSEGFGEAAFQLRKQALDSISVIKLTLKDLSQSIKTGENEQCCHFLEVLNEIIGEQKLLNFHKKFQFEMVQNIAKDSILAISSQDLRSILRNIISNSIKYGNSDNVVRIKSYIEFGHLIVLIQDKSCGFNQIQLEQFKNKMLVSRKTTKVKDGVEARNESMDVDSNNSFGLGLSLVSSIIERSAGTMVIRNIEGGSEVRMSLPLVNLES